MLVTIIIPVYNRAQKVKRTLNSVLLQTYRPLQLILVDNCSQDDTLAVLHDFKRCQEGEGLEIQVVQESRQSAGAARNKGFETATGEWVMFFDSDDEMLPSLVESYVERIGRYNGDLDVIAVRCRLVSQDGGSRNLPFFQTDVLANEILHSILATQRYIARREFLVRAGAWNEELLRWNDLEMGVRLMLNVPRMDFIDDVLVTIYDSGHDSLTGNDFSSHCGQWEQALDTIYGHIGRNAAIWHKQRYLSLIDFRRVALAARYAREGHEALGEDLYAQARSRLLKSSVFNRVLVPLLFGYIRSGKRGSSRLARILIR